MYGNQEEVLAKDIHALQQLNTLVLHTELCALGCECGGVHVNLKQQLCTRRGKRESTRLPTVLATGAKNGIQDYNESQVQQWQLSMNSAWSPTGALGAHLRPGLDPQVIALSKCERFASITVWCTLSPCMSSPRIVPTPWHQNK